MRMGRSVSGAHLAPDSLHPHRQGFGSARLWQGVAFPALGDTSRDAVGCACCEEGNSSLSSVHTLLHSYEDSHKNPARDQVYRTQKTDKWTSSGALLAVGRRAGQAGLLGVYSPNVPQWTSFSRHGVFPLGM